MERSQTAVINLLEKDYNFKVSPKPTIGMPVFSTEKYSKFDSFLQLDKDFAVFDAKAPIDWYLDYYVNWLTAFADVQMLSFGRIVMGI